MKGVEKLLVWMEGSRGNEKKLKANKALRRKTDTYVVKTEKKNVEGLKWENGKE